MGRNLSKYIMNWNYNNPVINGFYICCVKDYSFPFTLLGIKSLVVGESGGTANMMMGQQNGNNLTIH